MSSGSPFNRLPLLGQPWKRPRITHDTFCEILEPFQTWTQAYFQRRKKKTTFCKIAHITKDNLFSHSRYYFTCNNQHIPLKSFWKFSRRNFSTVQIPNLNQDFYFKFFWKQQQRNKLLGHSFFLNLFSIHPIFLIKKIIHWFLRNSRLY